MHWRHLPLVLAGLFQLGRGSTQEHRTTDSRCDDAIDSLYEYPLPESHILDPSSAETERFVRRMNHITIRSGNRDDTIRAFLTSEGVRGEWILGSLAADPSIGGAETAKIARAMNRDFGTSALPILFVLRDRSWIAPWDGDLFAALPRDSSLVARGMLLGFGCEIARLGLAIQSDSGLASSRRAVSWLAGLELAANEIYSRLPDAERAALLPEFHRVRFTIRIE